jgi:hypothetical protein
MKDMKLAFHLYLNKDNMYMSQEALGLVDAISDNFTLGIAKCERNNTKSTRSELAAGIENFRKLQVGKVGLKRTNEEWNCYSYKK